MQIETTNRAYMLASFSGDRQVLTQEETDQLIANRTIFSASHDRLYLRGHFGGVDAVITPATQGDGPAFIFTA